MVKEVSVLSPALQVRRANYPDDKIFNEINNLVYNINTLFREHARIINDHLRVKTRSIILTLDDFRKGVTAPTDATAGTTPTIPVLLFNATNELLSFSTVMPANWDKSKDCSLAFILGLASAQSNNDTLDMTVDYVTIKKNTTGAGVAKTSTQLTPSIDVTTATGLAIGDVYVISMVLAAADSDNGFALDDEAIAFCAELHLTNVTEVADIHLISGCINYESLY